MAALHGGPIRTDEYQRSAPDGKPLPQGLYKGIVVKTEQKDTSGEKGPGIMVKVEFDITWPEEFTNRKFWDNFNLVNPSEKTMQIAKEALADLGKAAGFPILEDDEQLMGQEVLMDLYIEKGNEYIDKRTSEKKIGQDKNKCRKYYHVDADIEAEKKAMKANKPSAAAAPTQGVIASAPAAKKWGTSAAPVASSPAQASQAPQAVVAQPMQTRFPVGTAAAAPAAPAVAQAAAPAGNVAPWKRNK